MSKESKVPLTQEIENDHGELVIVPLRWRRYPVSRGLAELIGANAESGHNVPPPSSRRKRQK